MTNLIADCKSKLLIGLKLVAPERKPRYKKYANRDLIIKWILFFIIFQIKYVILVENQQKYGWQEK